MRYRLLSFTLILALSAACSSGRETPAAAAAPAAATDSGRKFLLEQVDDASVIQLYADQFAA